MDDSAMFLIPVTMFAGMFGIAYVFLTGRFRERMAMIEKGTGAELFNRRRTSSHLALKVGMLAIGVACGVVVGAMFQGKHPDLEPGVPYFASIALFGGLALVAYFLVEKRLIEQERAALPDKDSQG